MWSRYVSQSHGMGKDSGQQGSGFGEEIALDHKEEVVWNSKTEEAWTSMSLKFSSEHVLGQLPEGKLGAEIPKSSLELRVSQSLPDVKTEDQVFPFSDRVGISLDSLP